MAKRKEPTPAAEAAPTPAGSEYTVLARRYRPRQFADLVGQEPVARALTNALQGNRVAHAYLFTGARGVGKTSTARILAKALNCVRGPTATPCDQCDACRAIATGDDVDVLEIDGASNRGIDEIRAIRQNVRVRPARSRYKIYIIDEVHMLSKDAFNALLKTLEEPPAHVKFIFATTEVQKIPVTILSRCQRFDFAGISPVRIAEQLKQVMAGEGMEADDEALELVARRAGGSMRDAQSLLDQLLAFGGAQRERLTAEQVRGLLGMANDDRVVALAAPLLENNPAEALDRFRQALDEGLQAGELLDQLIDYWRDLMLVRCAGADARDLTVSPRHREALARQAASLSLDTILAGLDVLTTTKSRFRFSNHGRVLIEMALVRLGRLTELVSLAQLAEWLGNGATRAAAPAPPTKPAPVARPTVAPPEGGKKRGGQPPEPEPAAGPAELTEATLPRVWSDVLSGLPQILGCQLEKAEVAISGPKNLVLRFAADYNQEREYCQAPNSLARTEEALKRVTGQAWKLRFEAVSGAAAAHPAPAAAAENSQSRQRRQRTEAMQAPLVKRAFEALGAQFVQMDEGFDASSPAWPAAEPGEE